MFLILPFFLFGTKRTTKELRNPKQHNTRLKPLTGRQLIPMHTKNKEHWHGSNVKQLSIIATKTIK